MSREQVNHHPLLIPRHGSLNSCMKNPLKIHCVMCIPSSPLVFKLSFVNDGHTQPFSLQTMWQMVLAICNARKRSVPSVHDTGKVSVLLIPQLHAQEADTFVCFLNTLNDEIKLLNGLMAQVEINIKMLGSWTETSYLLWWKVCMYFWCSTLESLKIYLVCLQAFMYSQSMSFSLSCCSLPVNELRNSWQTCVWFLLGF